jgi:hypothetical protein
VLNRNKMRLRAKEAREVSLENKHSTHVWLEGAYDAIDRFANMGKGYVSVPVDNSGIDLVAATSQLTTDGYDVRLIKIKDSENDWVKITWLKSLEE